MMITDKEREIMKKKIDAYRKKYPRTVREQILLNTVIEYTWTEGKGDNAEHDLHNDLLYRMKEAFGKDYPITRFHTMQIDFKVIKNRYSDIVKKQKREKKRLKK